MPPEQGKRILVVDDEPTFCETLKSRLEQFGYSVATATDARQGWKELEREPPHLILLDIRMPGEDGYTFLRKLRSFRDANDPEREDKIRGLPVIVITGAGVEMKSLFEQERISAFVTKPIDSAALRKLIEEHAR